MTSIESVFNDVLNTDSINIVGTNGSGSINFLDQVSIPPTPSTNTNLYFSASGNITIQTTDGFTKSITVSANANRSYTTPDVADANFIMSEGSQIINCTIISTSTITSSNLAGTNTGDVTVTAVGVTPNADGVSLSNQALTLQPASNTLPGVITASTQTLGGVKTFAADITCQANINLPITTITTGATGVILVNSIRFISSAGTNNAFIGSGSGNFTLSGTGNTVVGSTAATALTSGDSNVIVGYNSGSSITTANFNTIVGQGSGVGITTSSSNTIIGYASCTATMTGNSNTVIGKGAGLVITSGGSTTIVGANSGTNITSGFYNTIVGEDSGNGITTNFSTVIIGQGSGGLTVTGNNTTIIGQGSCTGGVTGNNNTIIGRGTCTNAFTGANNTVVGSNSTLVVTSANSNTIVGQSTANALTTANLNTAVGQLAAPSLTTGGSNVIIGRNAGTIITTGSNNIYISVAAGSTAEANTTRIGSVQTSAYMAGISSYNPTANYNLVGIDQTGSKLGAATTNSATLYTFNIIAGTATITAMSVRGVSVSSPWPYSPEYVKIGKLVVITFPGLLVSGMSGSQPTVITLGTNSIPAGLRPEFSIRHPVSTIDSDVNTAFVFVIVITTSGSVSFDAPLFGNFTKGWGILDDVVISYMAAT